MQININFIHLISLFVIILTNFILLRKVYDEMLNLAGVTHDEVMKSVYDYENNGGLTNSTTSRGHKKDRRKFMQKYLSEKSSNPEMINKLMGFYNRGSILPLLAGILTMISIEIDSVYIYVGYVVLFAANAAVAIVMIAGKRKTSTVALEAEPPRAGGKRSNTAEIAVIIISLAAIIGISLFVYSQFFPNFGK